MTNGEHPFVLGDFVDYQLGELPSASEEALEDHLFECARCAGLYDSIIRIGAAVREAARSAAVGANVTSAFLERATSEGLTFREYRLRPHESVACSAGPEDYFAVRLAAEFGAARELKLNVDFRDLESGESAPRLTREVDPDLDLGEVVLVFPGSLVRSYPRSLWSLTLDGTTADGPVSFGPFTMDHTP